MAALGKRALKAVEKEADKMVTSFANASTSAAESQLEWINEKLRGNVPLLYGIAGLLQNDVLCSMLDGTLRDSPSAFSLPGKGAKPRPLRASIKKLAQIPQTPNLPFILLQAMAPTIFKSADDWTEEDLVGLLCLGTGSRRQTELPSKYYVVQTVEQLCSAFSQRHTALGKPLEALDDAALRCGYFRVVDDSGIACALKVKGEEKVRHFKGAEGLEILDPYDPQTGVTMVMFDQKVTVSDLGGTFVELGVEFPDPEEQWDLDGLDIRETTPKKRARPAEPDPASASSQSGVGSRAATVAATQAQVTDLLRKRIKSKGAAASSSTA